MAGHVCLASRLGRILHSPSRSYETRWSRHILIQQQSQVRGHVTSRPAAESRGIDPPDVRRLAKMAHLSVTDEEVRPVKAMHGCLIAISEPLEMFAMTAPCSAGEGMGASAG